jgi:16S rRNA (cytosine967-C5)-methyltransferase
MKFHMNLVLAVIEIVRECMLNGGYADKLIEKTLKSDKRWGSRDRGFIAETAYDAIRSYRLLDYCCGGHDQGNNDEYIARIIGAYFILKDIELPDWDLFAGISKEKILKRHEQAKNDFAIFNSYPDELLAIVKDELPDTYQNELIALNSSAPLILRANTIVTNAGKLKSELEKSDIQTSAIPGIPDALIVHKKFNVFKDPLFVNGHYEIQDASSQMVAPFLKVEPGMRVIDACAGAGGKSLHLASIMQNKGKVLCLDIEDWKLTELRKRASRNKIQIIETRHIDTTKVIKRLHESCDRLLLDVPCSGLGVLRRNPDAKWKINAALLEKMKSFQKDILNRYSDMLRPDGFMVYATCSILPSENSKQIAYFCDEHRHFQLEEEKIISPALSGFDGFYMARLKKSSR